MNASPTDNPLLTLGERPPFDRIRPEHVEPAVDALVALARSRLETIGRRAGPLTYETTFGALDDATAELELAFGLVEHLEGLLGDADLRAAYNVVYPRVSAFYAAIPHDAALWAALKAFAESDAARALDETRARFLDRTVDEFRRHGADLEDTDKARLQAIEIELAELTNRFSQNVVDATDAFEWVTTDEAMLAGLPDSVRAAARADAEAKGLAGWRFTLHGPSYTPLMTYLDDAATRERFYRAFNTRAAEDPHDNRPLVRRVVALRTEKARLLGYRDIADLLLESRMVKSGDAADAFVRALDERTRPAFEREHQELEAFRRELEGDAAPPLAPWDLAYYAEKLRRARFALDEEEVRPYFEAERVQRGLYALVGKLYGVTITPLADWPVWHPSVQVFALDDDDGTRLGVFYVDLEPRPGKRGGAWMRPLRVGDPDRGLPHIGAISANLTPARKDRPALLRHLEVETIFHEFGHLLHHLLTRVPIRGLAGTNVAWDFVELPSQIMENWCWAREALDLFARHHETGEAIPDDLFDKMVAARTFRGGYAMMRQLGYATVDLALHRRYDPDADGDPIDYARAVAQRFEPIPLPDDYAMITGFSHLFASPVGYAAGYYSYKWAEVLDADAFTRFEAEGLFSREVGLAFRRDVLERGDSRDPAALYAAFMGRAPDPEALFVRAGLAGA
ncbi:MAG: M3 family metallopeptidase [Myxococcales bacterium]|nr:M3 family metallopeptidase [Myxococcales bacterium]